MSEDWTLKKTECWITDAFELWCWRRLLTFPWRARRSNQSILNYSLEELIQKLKLPILWPPEVKSWFIDQDPDSGKDWGKKEKGATEDEMVGWPHWISGYELEQTLGDCEGQGSLACCSPWGRKESDMTQWLNNNEAGRRSKQIFLQRHSDGQKHMRNAQ